MHNPAPRFVLLSICIFARRDDFAPRQAGCRSYVGQVVNLRPIVNRPTAGSFRHCLRLRRYAGQVGNQVGNLRRIGNPPATSCYAIVGQPILAAAAFQAASSPQANPPRPESNPHDT
jgi:hypothetical protein